MNRLFLLVAVVLVPAAGAQAPARHGLTVRVSDVKGAEGEVVISLFTRPDGFPADVSKADRSAKVPPGKPTHTFADLPAGQYVVVVFHDRNRDGKVDRSLFGVPKEPIGLSNHKSIGPKGGRPDFEKAKVSVPQAASVEVNLIEVGR